MAQRQPFLNRVDAGRQLARKLTGLRGEDLLVLGLPRGGIPVAAEIATALDAPLQPLFVKKVGAPYQPELAIGAVADGPNPTVILNKDMAHLVEAHDDFVSSQVADKLREIEARRKDYMGDRVPIEPAGRTVILVDDGIATGSTVKAALAILARSRPAKLILAIPVLPKASVPTFEAMVDALVYIHAPARLRSVGEHYRDFAQVQDEEVRDILESHAAKAQDPSTLQKAE